MTCSSHRRAGVFSDQERNAMRKITTLVRLACLLSLLVLGSLSASALAADAVPQMTFATPKAAADAVLKAAKDNDDAALLDIFGQEYRKVIISPDRAQSQENRELISRAARQMLILRPDGDDKVTIVVGEAAWPFPVPLVREQGRWRFDTRRGAEEILNRRIGFDELKAIEVARAYVAAQFAYGAKDRNNDGVRQFAQRLGSSPGKKDGLYWNAGPGEETSPFGPLVAAARGYAEKRVSGAPYRGYYFKILTRQGPSAPGGKYSYVINGRLIAGFALVAYPAEYGNTGVMTFVVNHYGDVHQKNLGPGTAKIAGAMQSYNPDKTWTAVKDE
jgi:hypothetical protein